jgi:hypothetical protein
VQLSTAKFLPPALDNKFNAALNEAAEEDNKRWNNKGATSVSPELVGICPAGQTAKDAPIVSRLQLRF